MKKLAGIFVIIIAIVTSVSAQKAETTLKNYYLDAEYFLAQEFFSDALHNYIEIYKRGYKDNANINYKIGKCYLEISGQKEKAIEYLEKAKKSASAKYKGAALNEDLAPMDVYLYLGNAYRVNNILNKAIATYDTFKTLIPKEEINLQKYADKQIEACKIAIEFMSNPLDLDFYNMGDIINGANDDYKAVVSGDGNTIIFMNKQPFYDAVKVSRKVNGKWTRPLNITPHLESDGDQYICWVSYDGNTIILTKEDKFNSDLYISNYIDKRWTPSKPIKGGDINTKYWESHGCISKDGKTLYFTSNRKGGIGEMDIYVSKLQANNSWGTAKNLGPVINTELNEDTPFISEDGKTLYFCSQSFTNMGGYDYFSSQMHGDTSWTEPENLGYPLSTTDEDLFFYPTFNDSATGYVSKIRSEGHGGLDIYRIGAKLPGSDSILKGSEQMLTEKAVAETIKQIMDKEAEEQISTTEKGPSKPVEGPKKLPETKIIELSPVLFEYDRAAISLAGQKELNKIVALMKNDTKLQLVITGFTDSRGSYQYNLHLSEKRALQALSFIVQKGINANRLKAIGKGAVDFIAPNNTKDGADYEEGRKYNRRAEFEISGADNNLLVIKRIDLVPQKIKQQGE